MARVCGGLPSRVRCTVPGSLLRGFVFNNSTADAPNRLETSDSTIDAAQDERPAHTHGHTSRLRGCDATAKGRRPIRTACFSVESTRPRRQRLHRARAAHLRATRHLLLLRDVIAESTQRRLDDRHALCSRCVTCTRVHRARASQWCPDTRAEAALLSRT